VLRSTRHPQRGSLLGPGNRGCGLQRLSGKPSGWPYSKINPVLDSSTTFTDSSVQSGQNYYYITTSVDSTGAQSSSSNEIHVVIPPPRIGIGRSGAEAVNFRSTGQIFAHSLLQDGIVHSRALPQRQFGFHAGTYVPRHLDTSLMRNAPANSPLPCRPNDRSRGNRCPLRWWQCGLLYIKPLLTRLVRRLVFQCHQTYPP